MASHSCFFGALIVVVDADDVIVLVERRDVTTTGLGRIKVFERVERLERIGPR